MVRERRNRAFKVVRLRFTYDTCKGEHRNAAISKLLTFKLFEVGTLGKPCWVKGAARVHSFGAVRLRAALGLNIGHDKNFDSSNGR